MPSKKTTRTNRKSAVNSSTRRKTTRRKTAITLKLAKAPEYRIFRTVTDLAFCQLLQYFARSAGELLEMYEYFTAESRCKSSVYNSLRRLREDGLITLAYQDGTVKYWSLTDEGRSRLSQFMEMRTQCRTSTKTFNRKAINAA